jgi:hypothetical protein
VKDAIKDVANMLIGFGFARAVPGILPDLAKMTDTVERKTSNNDVLGKLKNAIPGLRETLPEKKTIFGQTTATEPWWSTMAFGARVKTSRDSALIEELDALDKSGNLPSLSDVSRTSPRAAALREQIGQEKFDEAMGLYSTKLREQMEKVIQNQGYKNAPEEKKAELLNGVKNNLFDMMLLKYGYKKERPTFTKRQ